jgi:hypothetical protein
LRPIARGAIFGALSESIVIIRQREHRLPSFHVFISSESTRISSARSRQCFASLSA